MEPIVVTGLGAITPLGIDVGSTWQSMTDGRSGITRINEPWAERSPVQIAGQVGAGLDRWVSRVEQRRLDRVSQLALAAASQAWHDAGFSLPNAPTDDDVSPSEHQHLDAERIVVSIGTGIGGLGTILTQIDVLAQRGPARMSPFTITGLMTNAPAAHVGLLVGARGSVHAPVSACASGAEAIALGADQLRLGRADVAVVGGAEATVMAFGIGAFASMHALSRRNDDPAAASRPWDRGRDGFVMSEGAAVLVLETLSSAKTRGARILGTLAGYGISADGHDMVHPAPTGAGQQLAMRRALADAQLSPADIAHVNAHATSTPQGDLIEAAAIAEALNAASNCLVTSTKSMTGHLLGAAGSLEAIATIMALRERVVPPTINLADPEELPICVATSSTDLPDGDLAALTNSFGFGGHNVCLAFTSEHVE